jgi:hypothetical protein
MIRERAPLRVRLDTLRVLHRIMENIHIEEGRNGTSVTVQIPILCSSSAVTVFNVALLIDRISYY